jgi:hypothetical protein
MTQQVTVKGSWLRACGRGDTDKTFQVHRIIPTLAAAGSGFEVMYEIIDSDRIWTVAECRLVKKRGGTP